MSDQLRSVIKGLTGILAVLLLLPCLAVGAAQPAYAADSITVPVKISYEGKNVPTETFTVELSEGNLDEPVVKNAKLSMSDRIADLSFDIGELPLGIYEYKLKEIKGSTEDLSYDTREYTYYIMVNNDGTVEQKAVNKDDPKDKPDEVEFVNSYRSSKPDEVIGDPPVKIKKTISGKTPEEASEFVFVMAADGNTAGLDVNPMPEGYGDGPVEVTVLGDGEVEIGCIIFKAEGEYRYKVREKDTKIEGYSYDDAVFDIKYSVTRNMTTGKLECTREIYKNHTDVVTSGSCDFDNLYKGSPADRIKRSIETGDPYVMLPLTMILIVCIMILTVIIDRRRRER